jgi:hypothetical protein
VYSYLIGFAVPRLGMGLIDFFLPLVSPRTKELIKVFGYNQDEWRAEFQKTISPDQLPPQLRLNKTIESDN